MRQVTRSRFLGLGIEIANGSITPIDRWSDLGSSCSACSLPFQSASVPEGKGVAATIVRCAVKNLLVPVDFSDVTDRVITAAEQMARAFGAKVLLMHCVGEYPAFAAMGEIPVFMPVPDVALPGSYPEQYRKLADLTSSLRDKGIDAELLFLGGSAVDEIIAVADRHQIDMIIMGSHGHGAWYELLVGSVTDGVLRRVDHPTLIVPSEARKEQRVAATPPASQWQEPAATPY